MSTQHPYEVGEVLFRYEDPVLCGQQPDLIPWKVTKLTPCGCWIEYVSFLGPGPTRWMSLSRRPYARRTTQGAMVSYRERKRWQVRILERKLQQARHNFGLAGGAVNRTLEGFLE